MTCSRACIELLTAAFGVLLAAAAAAQSSEAPGLETGTEQRAQENPAAEWPCEAPLRPNMSIGAIWSGPDPAARLEDWRQVPAVAALVAQIAPRSMPLEEAVAAVRRFAAGYQGSEQAGMLTDLFSGVFETLNRERDAIVRGIKGFHRRQDALARRIEQGWQEMGEIDPNTSDPELLERRLALQQQIDWDSRIFDDRQRLLPLVCEQPRVLEQRVFALSRAILEQLPTH